MSIFADTQRVLASVQPFDTALGIHNVMRKTFIKTRYRKQYGGFTFDNVIAQSQSNRISVRHGSLIPRHFYVK